ncbi:MAG: hypothetical protein KI792_13240 [Alphaproteobacteria bacterium]|nr:hypothetical protein [Alphaproteobacteria bacterium SS10]
MIANADLIELDANSIDPMSVIQNNGWMMEEIWRQVARVGGSEISGGPVPAGGTNGAVNRAGRQLRRMGTGLSPANAGNAQAMARLTSNVGAASAIAAKTGRPNLLKLVQMTAQRAYHVALARGEVDQDRVLKEQMEHNQKMARRAAMVAGMYQTDRMLSEDVRFGIQNGMFNHWKDTNHMLGHVLADKLLHGGGLVAVVQSTVGRATQPIRGMVGRLMGRPEGTTPVNANLFDDGAAPKAAAPEAFELTTPTPDAPTPDTPAPVANRRPPSPMG